MLVRKSVSDRVARRKASWITAGLLSLAVAGTAAAGSGVGGVFNLGATNTVNYLTSLVGNYSKMLHIRNNSTSTSSFVLGLQTASGTPLQLLGSTSKPPLTTNSAVKVTNLNADRLDGLDQAAFLRANGNAASASRVSGRMVYTAVAIDGTAEGYNGAIAICPTGMAPTGGGYSAWSEDEIAEVQPLLEQAVDVDEDGKLDSWAVIVYHYMDASLFVHANCAAVAQGSWAPSAVLDGGERASSMSTTEAKPMTATQFKDRLAKLNERGRKPTR